MKKILPLVLILALAGGGYYLFSQKNTTAPQTVSKQISEMSQWAAAIASGEPIRCTITKDEEKMDYLIKGKKLKATITSKLENKTTTSFIVNDEKYLYMWEDGKDTGTKMLVPTEDDLKQMEDEANKYKSQMPDTPRFDESGLDNLKNEGYTLACDQTSATDTDFTPPTNIQFQDLSELTKAIPSPNATGEYDMKSLEEMAKKYGATIPSEE